MTATAGVTTPLDFALSPYEVVLADDVEAGNLGWTAQGQWSITAEASASPSHSWTDSPGGDYGNSWDVSLISPSLSLLGVADVFEVPLSVLMTPGNHLLETRPFRGIERRYYAMPYGTWRIWGVTAGIIRLMHDQVYA